MSLKICCGKNLRTDFAMSKTLVFEHRQNSIRNSEVYGGVGDFANFYDLRFYQYLFCHAFLQGGGWK